MADNTPKLGLPFMSTAQVQKELTFNELAAMVDTLVGLKVETVGDNAAPGAPTEGDAYIVGTAPTGVWAGKAKNIAFYIGGWHFIAPDAGWLAWNIADSSYYRYNTGSSTWATIAAIPVENLVELLDVDITTGPGVNGRAVTWDNASGKFVLTAVATQIAGLGDVNLAGLTDGDVLAWDSATSKFIPVPQTAATNFLALDDTPNDYAGFAGYTLAVNITEDGLELVPPGEGGGGGGGATAFTELTDAPPSYTGQGGLFVRVTSAEDGVEFVDVAVAAQSVPAGGLTNYVLRKTSDIDFETEWVDPADVGADFPDFAGNAGKTLVVNAGETTTQWVDRVYSVPLGFAAAPSSNEVLLIHVFAEPARFADDWAGSQKYVGSNPAAPFTLTINKNGVAVGTAVIDNTGAVAFTTTAGAVDFAIGDVMTVVAQATVSATIANVALTFRGTRT